MVDLQSACLPFNVADLVDVNILGELAKLNQPRLFSTTTATHSDKLTISFDIKGQALAKQSSCVTQSGSSELKCHDHTSKINSSWISCA